MPRTFLAWSWWMSWLFDGKEDRCVVAAGTVRFIFRRSYSVICVGLIGALRCWYHLLLFLISCVFLVSSRQEAWRICALLPLGPSVFSFVLVNSWYFVSGWLLSYDAGTDWVYFTFYAFLVSSWRDSRCVDAALTSILPFRCYRLGNPCRAARCGDAAVIGNFLLFRCCRFVILWRADWCLDAAVTVSFSFIFL